MMKGGTIVLLLATLAVAFADHHVEHHAADEHHMEDFDKLDARLDGLTARFVDLEHRVDARVDPARITRARSLRSKIVKLEGNGCDKHDFQCGGTDPQCVGLLLVCDGVQDCRNGADESHCDLPIKAGDNFEGHMIFDHCTKRQPEGMDIEITSVRKSVAFNSFVKVTANMHIEHETERHVGHVSFPCTGYYSQGAHKLVFYAPEKDRLYVVCDFDGWNFDRCVGHIKRESGEECAKLIFTRKH